jgi:hypothetical protein
MPGCRHTAHQFLVHHLQRAVRLNRQLADVTGLLGEVEAFVGHAEFGGVGDEHEAPVGAEDRCLRVVERFEYLDYLPFHGIGICRRDARGQRCSSRRGQAANERRMVSLLRGLGARECTPSEE